MAFYRKVDQTRPGLYVRISNRAAVYTVKKADEEEPPVDEPTGEVLVSLDGVLYDNGLVFLAEIGEEGETILAFYQDTGVTAKVIGETLVIQNPAR